MTIVKSLDSPFIVIGSQTDAAAPASDTATLVAMVKHIDGAVSGSTSTLLYTKQDGPSVVDTTQTNSIETFTVLIQDRSTGPLASGSITITGATAVLSKSTAGGAFSTAGITQPTVSKATGQIGSTVTFKTAEWSVGDAWRIVISGATATNSLGSTETVPQQQWNGQIDHDTAVSASVGTQADAASTTVNTSTSLQSYVKGLINASEKQQASTVGSSSVQNVEVNLGTFGTAGGTTHVKLQSAVANASALGAQTQLTFRLYVDVNGVETLMDSANVTATGVYNISNLLTGNGVFTSPRIRVAVIGNNAGAAATVSFTIETAQAVA